VEVVQLIDAGICFGVALAGIVMILRKRQRAMDHGALGS